MIKEIEMINWTENQYKEYQGKRMSDSESKKRNKYGAKKTTVGGITFDSKAEARRYEELMALQTAGHIEDLQLQPRFLLQENFCKNSVAYRAIYYVADFSYKENGKTIIEDVKGKKTQVYLLKKKLFEYRYPELEIHEIK